MSAVIETRGLVKDYGGVRALDGLDLVLEPGTIGLVGANGAGKTTLLRMLLGLSRPTSGSAVVAGLDVADDPVGVRARVGYFPEHDCLPPDQTAADLVASLGELDGLDPTTARDRASMALDLVGLDEARFRPIDGYSTGMRQRTKLAQAVVAGPVLVLLDEPTSGLDPVGRDEMLALVSRLSGFGISAVLATHLLEDVERTCDQVVMLDAGRVVAAGRTSDLLHGTGVVTVDVGPGSGPALARALSRKRYAVSVNAQGEVEVDARGAELDVITSEVTRAVARLELPLYRLTTGAASLDSVFVERARALQRSAGTDQEVGG